MPAVQRFFSAASGLKNTLSRVGVVQHGKKYGMAKQKKV